MRLKIAICFFFIVLVVLFSIKFNTIIYMAFEGGENQATVDATIRIDGMIIRENVVLSPAWSGFNVEYETIPFRMGFHKIEAYSGTNDVIYKKNVFILFNHYVMIEYWEDRDNFTVRTGFNPFRFE